MGSERNILQCMRSVVLDHPGKRSLQNMSQVKNAPRAPERNNICTMLLPDRGDQLAITLPSVNENVQTVSD